MFGSILLLFFPVFSSAFYGLYLFCGISDMVDGTIARKTEAESVLGARLDTIADFVFVAVSLIKFLPALDIPKWLWGWMAVIAAIRIGNMMSGLIFSRKEIALHTMLNKLTGFLLFLLPLSLHLIELKHSAVVVCAAATVSAVQEGWLMKKGENE